MISRARWCQAALIRCERANLKKSASPQSLSKTSDNVTVRVTFLCENSAALANKAATQ
jgi:hypothetical protein